MAIWITLFMAFGVMNFSLSCIETKYPLPQSCKELKERFNIVQDGIYSMRTSSGVVYQTYCDMTTAGGGWTLVASVHENNLNGRCTTGDRWSSQQGGNADLPEGDKSWRNTATFGTTEGATSDDYKNPGYYDITAEDVAVWHVPNDERVNQWKQTSFLRYHTKTRFLNSYGGNLYHLFQRFPVKYNVGSCPDDNGPSVPVVYDKGDATSNYNLYGPRTREETEPGYITFRAINNEGAATAICSGLKPKACNVEHYCIGGGGHFPEFSPKQCGDFTSFDCNGSGLNAHCSATKQLIEAAVLIFYR